MKKIIQFKSLLLSMLMIAVFTSCKKERECPGSISKDYAITGFSRITAGDVFHVNVSKGDDFNVKATGCSFDLDDLEITVNNMGNLDIKFKRYRNNRYIVDVNITMPKLNSLVLSGVAKAKTTGFQGQSSVIRAILSGESRGEIVGLGANLNVEISGNAKLSASGNTENLYGKISGNGELHAYSVVTPEADLMSDGNAKAYVMPTDVLFASASGNGRIYYKGSPVTHIEVSGNGKVIRE